MTRRLALIAVLVASNARAEAPSRVTISPARCAEASWAQHPFLDLLTEELKASGVAQVVEANEDAALATTPLGAVSIKIAVTPCAVDARSASIVMTEPLTRATRTREVDLAAIPPVARPRALALEAAELFRAGWTDAPAPSVASRVALVPPQPPAPLPREELRPRLQLDALTEARVYARGGAAFFGGRAAISGPIAPWLGWRVDAGGALGGARDSLGDVSTGFASMGLGLFALGGAPALALGVGPRLDVGVAWFDGAPATPQVSGSSGSGAVASLGADAFLRARLNETFSLVAEAEGGAGMKTLGATADGRLVVDMAGAFVAVRAGVAVTP